MNYATNFAIVENGVVVKRLWGFVSNMSKYPNAVQIDDRAVEIGDTYENGIFYHNGKAVKTKDEELAELRAALAQTIQNA